MPYLIITRDHPGLDEKREALREDHRAYLRAQGKRLLASGALLGEDGKTIVGGASLFDTDDVQEAIRFEAQDPYAKAGLRAQTEIVQWRLRWWIGEFNPDGHDPARSG